VVDGRRGAEGEGTEEGVGGGKGRREDEGRDVLGGGLVWWEDWGEVGRTIRNNRRVEDGDGSEEWGEKEER
jgi:hypothetical protein